MVDVLCPFDNEKIDEVQSLTLEEGQQLLERAYQTFLNKSGWLKKYERIEILKKLIPLMQAEQDELAMLIASEGGKPLVDAKVEVARAINGIEIAIHEMMHVLKGEEIPMGLTPATDNRLAFTTQEPIGVVFAISAFNHPLNLIVHQVIPAVAVGCPVLIKPANNTPLSCIKFIDMLHKAGLPNEFATYIVCNSQVAEALVTDKRVAFMSFIGSSKVGWYLRSKLAAGTRLSLELGGAAPVIIDNDVNDIDAIASSLLKGAFYHAGQVCVSVQRVFVHHEIIHQLADKLVKGVNQLKVGDARLADTDVGPLISSKEVDRVASWVDEAVAGGATLLAGGKKLSDTTYSPTILLNPSFDANVSKQEVFGPVMCLYSYDSVDDALNHANCVELPFQSAVFSNNLDFIMKAYKHLDTSAVMVNDHTAFRSDWMPFGGRRSTGYGVGGIAHTMQDMLAYKMIVIKNNNI